MVHVRRLVALLALSYVCAGCTPETSIRTDAANTIVKTVDCDAVTPTVTVMTLGLAYDPTPTSVPVGGIVKFVLPAQHNVTSATSGLFVPFGATMCLQFPEVGTYDFHCERHNFSGQVTVL